MVIRLAVAVFLLCCPLLVGTRCCGSGSHNSAGVATRGYEICSSTEAMLVRLGGGVQYGCRVPMLHTVGRPRGRAESEAKMAQKKAWGALLWGSFRSKGTIWGIVFWLRPLTPPAGGETYAIG